MSDENPSEAQETFGQFKDSFNYGSRTNLLFKFLRALPEDEAAAFFEDLLLKVGDTIDDGDAARIAEHVYEWQVRGYKPAADAVPNFLYDDGPFTPMRQPLSESRLGLIASSGHFMRGEDPEPFGVKDMDQDEATRRIGEFLRVPPILSEIPYDAPADSLAIRHGGYDITAACKDRNTQLPIDRLIELRDEGVIGSLSPTALSFVGAASQLRILKETGPQLAGKLIGQEVDAILLVAA